MVERGSITSRERRIPIEPVSDAELGNFLAVVGNHEGKAIKFLKRAMGDDMTEDDQKKGIPLVGFLLGFSLRHPNISLGQLLGKTNSSSKSFSIGTSQGEKIKFKKRSPLTRVEMMRVLVSTSQPLQEVDIARALEEDKSYIGQHLRRLAFSGIITHDGIDPNKPRSYYQLSLDRTKGDSPNDKQRYPSLAKDVYEIAIEHPEVLYSIDSMVDQLAEKNPKRKTQSRNSLYVLVGVTLRHLTLNGYLTYEKLKGSEVSLSPSQREIVEEFLTIIKAFQGQKPIVLNEGREIARKILSNSDAVAILADKAKRFSPDANRLSQEESTSFLVALIHDHPGISNRELQKALQKRGVLFSPERIRQLTRRLENDRRIEIEREGFVRRFSPIKTS